MNTLTPRPVETPALRRWVRETFRLMVRAPGAFASLAGAMVLADDCAVHYAPSGLTYNQVLPMAPFLAAPLLAAATMIARFADLGPAARTAQQFNNAMSWRVLLLMAAAVSGFIFAMGLVMNLLQSVPVLKQMPMPFVHGALVVALRTGYITMAFVCTPIIVPICLYAAASPLDAYGMATMAVKANISPMLELLAVVLFGGLLSTQIHSYGVVASCFMVAQATLSYIAFRDIYEGRAESAPEQATALQAAQVSS